MQCLIYLAGREAETTPVRDLMEALRLSPGPCREFVGSLAREGLVGLDPSPTHPLPRAVRLSARGRAKIREWQAHARAEPVHART